MSEDKTLERLDGDNDKVAQAINRLNENLTERMDRIEKKVDNLKRDSDIQFEAIRTGIVANSAAFDRLGAKVLMLSANMTETQEEIRQQKKEYPEEATASG